MSQLPINVNEQGEVLYRVDDHTGYLELNEDPRIRSLAIVGVKKTPRWYKAGTYDINRINKDTGIPKRKLKNYFAFDWSTIVLQARPGDTQWRTAYPTSKEVHFLLHALGMRHVHQVTSL